MALVKESDIQPLVNKTLAQIEQGYFNVDLLVGEDPRLSDLSGSMIYGKSKDL